MKSKAKESPSTRREWIEMTAALPDIINAMSPSTRREWIEITPEHAEQALRRVSLHTEGVD